MAEYMAFSIDSTKEFIKMTNELKKECSDLFIEIGVSQQSLMKYQSQLGPVMERLMQESFADITVEDARQSLEMRIEYLKEHGNHLVEKIIEGCILLSVE